MRRLAILVASLLVLSQASTPRAQSTTWRPVIFADNGMVASGHALASEAALQVLRNGGNAVDAAVAAWAVQGLTEPEMTGLGGDMFMLVYLAKTGEVKFINGTGQAPMAATAEFYKSKGGIPADGPLSVNTPGSVGAAELAVQRYGTRRLNQVLEPAAQLAENGFPVSESLAGALRNSREKLAKVPSARKIWFTGDRPLEMGERVVQKDLAQTLRTIGSKGADAFYRGAIAEQTASYLKSVGGLLAAGDLAAYRPFEDAPIHVDYKGIDVYECPPNSQGFVMLQALNLLEGLNVQQMKHNTAPYLHAVTESLKLAFADRNRFVGDPKFVPTIPMRELLSKEYAATRRALIDASKAIQGEAPAGDPLRSSLNRQQVRWSPPQTAPIVPLAPPAVEDGHTTYLAVVDKDRNMVSITSSLLSTFGSGHVVEGAGFFLNNRMAYFGLDDDDVNVLKPGKRPRHTINPALALKDGKPYMVFGTPGADTQPQAQLQFFLNVVEFGMNVQEALEASSIVSTSFRGSYYPHEIAGTLQVSSTLPKTVLDGLAALGHKLDIRNVRGVGSVKAIIIHPKTGVLMGGVSPTRDSYVMAW
jgi:gamma-glutamyltranspeptidase/glutathione hydrolase